MKKIAGLAVLIVTALTFAWFYRLQTLGFLDTNIYAVAEKEAGKALTGGLDETDDANVLSLTEFQSGEALYRRGNRYYLGTAKTPVDLTWPFYANGGTSLYFMGESTNLITSDFASFPSYEDLFISNGASFAGESREKADEEEYIMASVSGGLFLNVQPMKITGAGQTTEIRLNSILYLDPSVVRSYSFEDGRLVYSEAPVFSGSVVTVGSVSMTWDEFLTHLGKSSAYGTNGTDAEQTEVQEEELPLNNEGHNRENNNSGNGGDELLTKEVPESIGTAGNSVGGNSQTLSEEDQINGDADAVTGNTEADTGSSTSEGTALSGGDNSLGDGQNSGGSFQDANKDFGGSGKSAGGSHGSQNGGGHNSGSTGANNGNSGNGGSSSGSSGGSGTSGGGAGNGGSSSGGGSGSGNDNQGGDTGAVDDDKNNSTDPAPPGYTEPTAELAAFKAKVYEAESTLTITDPDSRLIRVVVEFIEKDTGKRGARKNLRQPGSFRVQNLKPETEYKIRGSVVFRNSSGARETKVFVEDLSATTLPISTYKPLTLKFGEAKQFYADKILIPDIVIQDTQTAEGEESLKDYVSKIIVTIPNQTEDYREEAITGAQVRNARNGKEVNWLSDEVFASDKEYPFTMKLVDRHGNELPLTADSVTAGTAHTCKKTPAATITETANEVGKQTVMIKLSNRDGVKLENLYLQVLDEKNNALAAFARRGDDTTTRYYLPLDEAKASSSAGETVMITELPAGISCRVVVTADYDMKNSDPSVPIKGGVLGKCSIYTAPISRLGSYYMNVEQTGAITATSFEVKINTNTARTLSGLRELTEELPLTVSNSDGQVVYESKTSGESGNIQIFSKEYLSQEKFSFGEEAVPNQLVLEDGESLVKPLRPVITMSKIPSGSANAWEALINGATIDIAFPVGQFASKTSHTVRVGANAYQGGTKYQVGAATNTCLVKTTLMPTKISYENLFTISDFCDIYGLYIDDPDGAVRDGNITMRLFTQGSQVSARTLKTNTRYDDLKLERLHSDSDYYVYFEAAQYNEGYGTTTEVKQFDSATLKFRVGQGITGSIELQGVAKRENDLKHMDGSVRVRLIDRKEELVDEAYELKVYGKAGVDSDDSELQLLGTLDGTELGGRYQLDQKTNVTLSDGTERECPSTDKVISYPARYNWKYRVELWLNVKISSTSTMKISLGSVTYTTDTELVSITSWKELYTKCANKSGHFVVTEDIVKDTNNGLGTFKGTLDFQGHKLIFSKDTNHTGPVCSRLDPGAVIENLEIEYNAVPHREATSRQAPLVYENYGTVRNVISHINWNSRYAHTSWGGIVVQNYKSGVIENFVVSLDQTVYVDQQSGLVCAANYGTIRNGYSCSTPGQSGISYLMVGSGVWGGQSKAHYDIGAITGINIGGTIENVFSLVNIQAEREKTESIIGIGGIAGTLNGGIIRNSFWVGDIFQYAYKDNEMTEASIYNEGGGAIGNRNNNSYVTENLYNITLQKTVDGKLVEYGYQNGRRTRDYARTETTQALWSSIWYRTILKDADQYLIEDQVTSGLYPKVLLSDELMPEQENLTLPSAPAVSRPEYIGNEVETLDTDTAVLKMYLRNPYNCEITGFTIDGLTMDSILSQSSEGDFYEVRLKVKDPQKFKSYYLLSEIRFKWSETTPEDSRTYTEADDKRILVKFYKQIHTADDWQTVLDDPSSNIQLAEPVVEINLNNISADKVIVTKSFTGEFDGNGNTLKFTGDFPAGQSFVFDSVSGAKIYDLTVEGLSFATDETNTSNVGKALTAGLIKAADKSELTNIFVKDISLLGMPGTAGALAGTITSTTVRDCRAENVTIRTALYPGSELRVGGLFGYISSSTVENCYVSALTLTAEKGGKAGGIGGLAGTVTGNFGPESCYAEGTIRTSFWGTGGLVGNSLSPISNSWTYVNITSNTNGVGGILGRAPLATRSDTLLISNCVAVGDIVTGAASGYNRICGHVGSGIVSFKNCGANRNQIIGTAANTADLKDANYLVGEGDEETPGLGTIEFYRDFVRIGNSFVMDDGNYPVDAGYMPLLKKKDGSRFDPEQTPIQRREEKLKVINVSMSIEPSGTYRLEVTGESGDSGFKIFSAACDNLEIDQSNKKIEWNDAGGTGKVIYEGVSYKSFVALYQIQVTFERGNAKQTLTYQLKGNMARKIGNIEEWRQVMKEHGQDYENIELTGDIDFSGVTQKELLDEKLVNLKINSIRGNGHTMKNFSYTAQADGEAMIKTVSGALEDLNFENMKFSAVDGAKKYGGENVGLIGELNGSASNLSFDKVTVDAPAANQVGCIGSAMGDVKDVKLKDISVNGKDYTGGLIGILMKGGSIENVTAEGTANLTKNYAYFKQLEQKKAEDPKGNANLVTKPMQTDYSYVVTGANHCGGIAGQARGMVSKIEIRGAYVGNGKDYSGSQHGGIVGSSYSYNTDFLIGDPEDQTIPVRVSGLNDTAGGVGYVHWSATKVERANGYHLYVDGNTNIAGLVGQDTVAYHCRLYKSTVSGTTRVSGIMAFGSGTMSRYSEVRECEIYGSTRVSGISAEGGASYSALINSTVTGSSRYIGGIVGYDRGSINYCTVTGSKIIGSTANSEKATVVGGLIGFGNAEKSYVADTVVSGYSIVGGAVGWTIGTCNNISVEADVSAAEGYAGGFTGILTSYSWKSIEQYYSERFPYVHDVTVGGTVHAPTYAGGFAGIVETYPPEYDNMTGDILQQGSDGLDGDHFYNIQLMLKEINCDSGMTDYRNKTTMWGYFTQDRLSLDGKISYTPDERINSHQIDGITPTASRKSRSSVWVGTTSMDSNGKPIELISDSGKAGYVTWTKDLGTSWDLAWTTTADLKTEDFWKNSGLTTKDAITQALKLDQVPWRNSIDSISGDKITWVVNYSTDAIPTDGWWSEVSSNTWNAADYMNGTASKTYGYSNGTTGESYDDVFKAPGIFEIPVSDKTISTFSLDEMGDDLVTCYASGAGLLNLELADGLYGVHISVADSSGELLSADADRRVYTMPYDFSAPLTVTLSAGDMRFEYPIAASEVVHTVMSWKGRYYYLTSDGLYWSDGTGEADEDQKVRAEQHLISGHFLNLYGGHAIDTDGTIWNVETGEKEESLDFTNLTWAETTPLHTFRYEGRVLDVYAHFTDSWETEPGAEAVRGGYYENEDAMMLDTLPYVKSGKLFVLDGEAGIHTDAVIADTYGDNRYLTVLGTDGCMHDIEPAITVPKGFKNRGILELAGNLEDDSHIAIGRYGDGTVFAFNYLTGTEQVLENTCFDVGAKTDFISFATDWINSTIGSWFGFDNSGYEGSRKLISEVSSGELDAALGAISGMEQGRDQAEDGNNSGVSGTGKNGTGTDSAASDSSDRVENVGDPAEDGIVSDDEELTDSAADDSENRDASGESDDLKKDMNSADSKETSDEEKNTDGEKTSKEEKNTDSEKASKEETKTENAENLKKDSSEDGAKASETEKAADKAKTADETKASSEAGATGETKASDGTGAAGETKASDGTETAGETKASDGTRAAENGAAANAAGGTGADGTGNTSIREKSTEVSASGSSQAAESGKADDSQKAESTAAGETSAEPEDGTDAADGAKDGGTDGSLDVSGTAGSTEKPASKSELVSVYDAETGKYQVYTVEELLSAPRSQISSVNEKITKLSREGLITRHSDLDAKEFVENNKKGVIIFGATAAAIILLLILMAELRRDRKKN